ncbi:WXG100 family type VII secretion target [Lentzea sp. NPDC054927]
MSTPTMGPAPTPTENPLVRKGEDTPATEGAGLFHDVTEAVTGFADGNWAEGLLNLASAAGDIGKMLTDPLAYLFSAGFGWLMEHVSFLKEPLDWLTGDQQTLDGMAQTWSSVSSYLDEISTDLKDAVNKDAGQWVGKDSEKYREFGADRADTYGAVGTAARGMSILITICKTILKVVRDIVRDLISEAIGKLISICLRWAPAVAALGAGIAGAVAEAVPTAVRYAQKCIEWCRKLTKAFSKAGGLFKKLDDTLASASVNLAKRGDDFVTVLKQGANADIARAMKDFNVGGMLKDAGAGAKKVIVDGVTGLPKDIGPAMAEEFRKEGSKIVDDRGWKDWRELKKEEDENK